MQILILFNVFIFINETLSSLHCFNKFTPTIEMKCKIFKKFDRKKVFSCWNEKIDL